MIITTNKLPSAWAAIYVGCECMGHVFYRRSRGIEAFDRDDKSLGLFPTQTAAVEALERCRLLEEAP